MAAAAAGDRVLAFDDGHLMLCGVRGLHLFSALAFFEGNAGPGPKLTALIEIPLGSATLKLVLPAGDNYARAHFFIQSQLNRAVHALIKREGETVHGAHYQENPVWREKETSQEENAAGYPEVNYRWVRIARQPLELLPGPENLGVFALEVDHHVAFEAVVDAVHALKRFKHQMRAGPKGTTFTVRFPDPDAPLPTFLSSLKPPHAWPTAADQSLGYRPGPAAGARPYGTVYGTAVGRFVTDLEGRAATYAWERPWVYALRRITSVVALLRSPKKFKDEALKPRAKPVKRKRAAEDAALRQDKHQRSLADVWKQQQTKKQKKVEEDGL